MAKKNAVKKPTKKERKVKEVITHLTCPDACHYWHKVYTHDPSCPGVGCTKGLQRGTKNSPHAFNLAKGFNYKITHTRLRNGKCKLKIEQGPYVGCPSSAKAKATLLQFGLSCEDLTCSLDNCPSPDEVPNSTCTGCELPPRSSKP